MNQVAQPYRQPEATPVGHSGTRVEIHERPAWAISGWFGVLAAAACIAATILLADGSAAGFALGPALAALVILTSLVIVSPGDTKVVRFFGELRRHPTPPWAVVDLAARRPEEPERSGQELRDQPSEGQRL
jgi:hypothetical protein